MDLLRLSSSKSHIGSAFATHAYADDSGTLVATESGFDIEHSPDVDNVGQWSNTTLYQSEWLPEGRHSIRYVNVGPQTDIEEEYMTGSDLSYLVLDSLVVTYRTSNSESEQTNLLSDPSILESSPSETSEIVHSPSPNTAHRPISEANVSTPSISTTATTSVTGTTSVRSEKESSSSDSPSSGSPPDAAIIGLAIGCSALICIFFALAWRVFRRRRMGDRSSDWRTVKSWAASSHSSESKAEEAGRIESGFGS